MTMLINVHLSRLRAAGAGRCILNDRAMRERAIEQLKQMGVNIPSA
jgi:hypothetical protein